MQGRWRNNWAILPAFVLLAALGYSVVLNVLSAVQPSVPLRGQDGLQVSPELAFDGLQVLAGGGMWLVLLWAVLLTVKSLRHTEAGTHLPWHLPRVLAALTLLMFSLPAWWLWLWTMVDWLGGRQTADFSNWHYVLAAVCQPFLLFLPLQLWHGQRRLRRTAVQAAQWTVAE